MEFIFPATKTSARNGQSQTFPQGGSPEPPFLLATCDSSVNSSASLPQWVMTCLTIGFFLRLQSRAWQIDRLPYAASPAVTLSLESGTDFVLSTRPKQRGLRTAPINRAGHGTNEDTATHGESFEKGYSRRIRFAPDAWNPAWPFRQQ